MGHILFIVIGLVVLYWYNNSKRQERIAKLQYDIDKHNKNVMEAKKQLEDIIDSRIKDPPISLAEYHDYRRKHPGTSLEQYKEVVRQIYIKEFRTPPVSEK